MFSRRFKYACFVIVTISSTVFASSSSDEERGWTWKPTERGTQDILRSCLFTTFLCCWTVVHPNIPPPGSSPLYRVTNRILGLLIAALAPEALVLRAVYEYARISDSFKEHKGSAVDFWTKAHEWYALMGGFCVRVDQDPISPLRHDSAANSPMTSIDSLSKTEQVEVEEKETRTQGEYRYLPSSGITRLLREGKLCPQSIVSERDIRDKDKADKLVRALALLQILWSIIHFCSRLAADLPLAPIEITTLALIPFGLCSACIWWHKPYEIGRPSILSVPAHALATVPDGMESTRRYWKFPFVRASYTMLINALLHPTGDLTDSFRGNILWVLLTMAALAAPFFIFGGIHLSAWNTSFPTATEQFLWRLSASLVTFSIPASWLLNTVLLALCSLFNVSHATRTITINFDADKTTVGFGKSKYGHTRSSELCVVQMGINGLAVLLYLLARAFLLVEALISMRSLPVTCYKTVQWSQLWPHF